MNRREKATRENGEQWRYDYNARGEVISGGQGQELRDQCRSYVTREAQPNNSV